LRNFGFYSTGIGDKNNIKSEFDATNMHLEFFFLFQFEEIPEIFDKNNSGSCLKFSL
jgi:hypothetical protein